MTVSGEDREWSNESTPGVTGDGCGCQKVVEVVGSTWVKDDGVYCGHQKGVGVVGSIWVEDDGVDGVRGKAWQ